MGNHDVGAAFAAVFEVMGDDLRTLRGSFCCEGKYSITY